MQPHPMQEELLSAMGHESADRLTWKAFSAAEHLAVDADKAWQAPKDRGNDALKRKDYAAAADLYREAALLAMGPLEGGAIHAFISALEAWPENSAQRMFVENQDLLWTSVVALLPTPAVERRVGLPDGTEMVAKYPNKGAAIAWSNHAQALLLGGAPNAALCSARRATEANPEYLKGHHREMKALEALGDAAAARTVMQEMTDYQLARRLYPSEALALLHSGWISWERAILVYGPERFRVAALAAVDAGAKRVEARASIVPFQGGQLLILMLVYGARGRTIECMDCAMVDTKNGAMADQPPSGHASPDALERAPILIGKFMTELLQYELTTVAVMLGQGLVEHVDYIDERLKAGHPGTAEPFNDVLVYASSSTHAGEANGVPPTLNHQRSMEAMMERLLPG